MGVNSRVQLAQAEAIMRKRINKKHMDNGVTIINPENTYIEANVQIGKDTIIEPGVMLRGNTEIGDECIIGMNSSITNSKIGNFTEVKISTIIDSAVGENTTVGPYAYLRPNSNVGNHVKICLLYTSILDTSIYTSFDFIKQYKTWKQVTIDYGDETKKVIGWSYDDLASKMVQKRLVGKIQPEKARARCKYKFTINIKSDNYEARVDIMGEDYVKITVNNLISYYEVSNNLYNYIKTDIFKIADSE